jgi:hypothetical protein
MVSISIGASEDDGGIPADGVLDGITANDNYKMTSTGKDYGKVETQNGYQPVTENLESHIISLRDDGNKGLLGLMPGSEMYFINPVHNRWCTSNGTSIFTVINGYGQEVEYEDINEVPIENYEINSIVFLSRTEQCYKKIKDQNNIKRWEKFDAVDTRLKIAVCDTSYVDYFYIIIYSQNDKKWLYDKLDVTSNSQYYL